MMQCKLDADLSLVKPPPFRFCFFDLPFNIRCRIYEFAGLVRSCPVDLNYEPTRKKAAPAKVGLNGNAEPTHQCYDRRHFHSCHCEPLPWGLIRASREASYIFYSRNQFKVCQSWSNNLQGLHNLTATSLSALVNLSIRLNFCSSYSRPCRHPPPNASRDEPLKEIIPSHEEWILADWARLCERMAQHIQHSRLRLSFICDTESVKTAKAILAPLLKLPTLAQCSIRLSQYQFPQFQDLAEEAVEQLTTSETSFPFHALPIELQVRILHQTDLIAPSFLEWTPLDGFYCQRYTVTLISCPVCIDMRGVKPSDQSAFATRCSCWKFPYGLFYTNRIIREEALNIFYAKNHFIIPYDRNEQQPRLNLSSFLSLIPQHARSRLKSLQFKLPETVGGSPPDSQEHHELNSAVNILCADANLSRLELTIEICPRWNPGFKRENHSDGLNEESLRRTRFLSYQKMLEPLGPLSGKLEDFLVFLPWTHRRRDYDLQAKEEEILESRIMGPERYPSMPEGKYDGFLT